MRHLALPALTLLSLVACSSGGREVYFVDPQPALVKVGERLPLKASPAQGTESVPTWEVVELEGGTLLKSQGWQVTYQAPAVAGRYRIALNGTDAKGRKQRQITEVEVQPVISMEPANLTLAPGASRTLQAKVRGSSKVVLHWAVEEDQGGTVTQDGTYTAPAVPGTYHVTATGELPWGIQAIATIRVQ